MTIFIQDEFTADQSSQSSFTTSRRKELNGLLESGVFEVVDIKDVPQGIRSLTLDSLMRSRILVLTKPLRNPD
jgi:hypothetical protein